MENSIIRGQPWTIRLRLKPEQIVVGNIQGIYLAVVQGANKTVKIFTDREVSTEASLFFVTRKDAIFYENC